MRTVDPITFDTYNPKNLLGLILYPYALVFRLIRRRTITDLGQVRRPGTGC